MGSWNKTCGISNLHINAGDDVYVFVLEKNQYEDERCHSTAFFKPLLLPFESKYDDYGGGEDSSGIALPYIMDAIKDQLTELDVGENEYHDIAVKKDKWDVELFFEAVNEYRLMINNGTHLDFVMLRKDVVDHILDTWTNRQYVGSHKGNSGHDNSYVEFGFKDILLDIPEYLDALEGKIRSIGDLAPSYISNNLFAYGHPNKVSQYVVISSHRYAQVLSIQELLVSLLKSGDRSMAESILAEHLKAVYIECFFGVVRKAWLPGVHEGSQSNSQEGYRILSQAISNVLDNELENS